MFLFKYIAKLSYRTEALTTKYIGYLIMRTSIKKYKSSFADSVVDADPHTLISIIFKHILINVAIAKGAIPRKEIENKSRALIKAMALVGELQDSIDMEQGGEISINLFDLYQYAIVCLTEANIENNTDKLDEVTNLITNIKEGWEAIPLENR